MLGPVAPHGPRSVALAFASAAERAPSALSRRGAAPIPAAVRRRQIAAAVASALGGDSAIDLSVCIGFRWCPHVHSLRTPSAGPQPSTARSSALAARPLMGAVVAQHAHAQYKPPQTRRPRCFYARCLKSKGIFPPPCLDIVSGLMRL